MNAYLLAAGRGRRAGGPKAWKPAGGGAPLLELQVGFLTRRFRPESVAVSIQEEWLDSCRSLHPRIHWIAVDPDDSPLASLQALLKAMPAPDWASVHHVDMPVFEDALWDALCAAAKGAVTDAVVPSYKGKAGHPVFLAPGVAKAILKLDPEKDRLDRFLRERRKLIELPHRCALENLNTER